MAWQEWVRTVEVEPSLYAADFARLGEQIDVLLRAGARVFHFDTGDGHFVPPVTIGPAHAAGATLLVAGSAIFGREDLAGAYRALAQDVE